MDEKDYVLGLEPANCYPDGRDNSAKNGELKILKPGEKYITNVKIDFTENENFVLTI